MINIHSELTFFSVILILRGQSNTIYTQVDEQIQKYIGLKSAISFFAAVLVFLVFKLLQVNFGLVFLIPMTELLTIALKSICSHVFSVTIANINFPSSNKNSSFA